MIERRVMLLTERPSAEGTGGRRKGLEEEEKGGPFWIL